MSSDHWLQFLRHFGVDVAKVGVVVRRLFGQARVVSAQDVRLQLAPEAVEAAGQDELVAVRFAVVDEGQRGAAEGLLGGEVRELGGGQALVEHAEVEVVAVAGGQALDGHVEAGLAGVEAAGEGGEGAALLGQGALDGEEALGVGGGGGDGVLGGVGACQVERDAALLGVGLFVDGELEDLAHADGQELQAAVELVEAVLVAGVEAGPGEVGLQGEAGRVQVRAEGGVEGEAVGGARLELVLGAGH